ncbi:MAG: hypothetical protein J7L55_01830, partial [Desulfurococcales archaeon]|nr:hypothetical protein [Desulfurococcales archaeon]
MGVVLKVVLADTVVGGIAADEEGNILAKVFPESRDINSIVERAKSLEEGAPSKEFESLIDQLVNAYGDVTAVVE